MLVDFPEHMTNTEKFNILLAYHNIPNSFKYEEVDIPMLILALNQDDVSEIKVDDEGAIEIGYSGTDWQNEYE